MAQIIFAGPTPVAARVWLQAKKAMETSASSGSRRAALGHESLLVYSLFKFNSLLT